jgi:hypothetical protein
MCVQTTTTRTDFRLVRDMRRMGAARMYHTPLRCAVAPAARIRADRPLRVLPCDRPSPPLMPAVTVNAGRETISYVGESLANFTRPLTETLGDLVKRPMFIDFELRDLIYHYKKNAEERERTGEAHTAQPDTHRSAFSDLIALHSSLLCVSALCVRALRGSLALCDADRSV